MSNPGVFVLTSWDDTSRLDLRICEALEKYGIRGTFFTVSDWVGPKILAEELRHISQVHEIGGHTISHATLTYIQNEYANREIRESRLLLEDVIGKPVTSFAYPRGMYNQDHLRMVKEAGYICARTTKLFHTESVQNPFEMNVTISAYPHAFRDIKALFRLSRISKAFLLDPFIIKNWSKLGKQVFDELLKSGGTFHLFGHAWQIDQMDGWKTLEDLLEYVSFRENTSYLTMTEYVISQTRSQGSEACNSF